MSSSAHNAGDVPSQSTLATSPSLIADVSDPAKGLRWGEFDRIYRGIVLGMARKAGLNHHDAEDVAQEVFSDLVRSLVGFEVRKQKGSFRSYLFQLARWRIASKFGQLKRSGGDRCTSLEDSDRDFADPKTDAESGYSEAEFRSALIEALRVLAGDLDGRDVQVLDLYYRLEWPAERIAASLGLTRTAVYVLAHRQKFRLCREILRRL